MCPYYCVILLQLWQPILSSYFLYYRHFGPNCWNRLILLPQKTYYGVRQGKSFILEDLHDETPVHVLLRKRSLWSWLSSESWSLSSPRCSDIIENLSQILRNWKGWRWWEWSCSQVPSPRVDLCRTDCNRGACALYAALPSPCRVSFLEAWTHKWRDPFYLPTQAVGSRGHLRFQAVSATTPASLCWFSIQTIWSTIPRWVLSFSFVCYFRECLYLSWVCCKDPLVAGRIDFFTNFSFQSWNGLSKILEMAESQYMLLVLLILEHMVYGWSPAIWMITTFLTSARIFQEINIQVLSLHSGRLLCESPSNNPKFVSCRNSLVKLLVIIWRQWKNPLYCKKIIIKTRSRHL